MRPGINPRLHPPQFCQRVHVHVRNTIEHLETFNFKNKHNNKKNKDIILIEN